MRNLSGGQTILFPNCGRARLVLQLEYLLHMLPECYSTSFTGFPIKKGWSDFHYYEFVQHSDFGLCLFLDGVLQSAESDQRIYHQKLVRAALEEHPNPSEVLIVGGAGGGVLHQLRSLIDFRRCKIVVVDIDEKLFDIARRTMRSWGDNELDDPSVEIVFANGRDYLQNVERTFDMIILDVGDPLPHTRSNDMYSADVLRDLGHALRSGGVVSFHTAPEHTLDHIFVTESLHAKGLLRKMSHFLTDIPSFERAWMFNTLKKQVL